MTRQRIAVPTSTGGAGTFFEQHVAAYWLAQLLVRCMPPILTKTIVSKVHFQTGHLGWHTDDFLVVCESPGLTDRKLAGQVKLGFTVSAANKVCRTTIQDFWKDFRNPGCFSPPDDRLLLVVQRGTNTLLEHFGNLLDCARAAPSGAEFERRLTTEGFISAKAVGYCDELCKIIAGIEQTTISRAEIWSLLRLLYVLSLDLDTSTRQTESQIKSLLAYTVVDGDASGIADATWNSLLTFASTAMSQAGSFHRADLPTELQHRHGSLGTNEQRVLQSLTEHTGPVLGGIRSRIGQKVSLQRAGLIQNVLSALDTAQVVLVSGPAGIGKSVIGKDVVSLLSRDHFVFGFRAEEFAQAHIDATLSAGQIPTNAKKLAAILAPQGRKVVLIESVERLLEKTTRDAFSDLMTLAAEDRGLCIVLTCRDYSVQQILASFLQPVAVNRAVVHVLPLNDAELAEVEAALPELAYPLRNSALRDILRNPYFLDKALDISWSEERALPESEREFRALFWRQIVCADQSEPAGMARRRESIFREIAVRRARALSAYVMCNDLDPTTVDSLRRDSLIVVSEENPSLLAPAHDVLEDWAILHWLEEQFLASAGSLRDLSAAIGTHPAIRRSYRKWIAELVERDPEAADRLFLSAISGIEISAQFQDDTLVSLLKAPTSPEFLERHEAQLLAHGKALLKRVIHLLRVACMTTPDWLSDTPGYASIFNVPDGPSWPTVLKLMHRNLGSFTPQELPLLIGLIEDAVRGVSWWAPKLDGAEFVAAIGHWLLAGLGSYRFTESRKRVLKVIAKLPKADPIRFKAILRGTERENQRRDPIADDLRGMLFSGAEGMPAARDLPDLVVSAATDYLLAAEDDIQRDHYFEPSLDLEIYFGFKDEPGRGFFPPSAIRGPWFYLLQYHPNKGLDFFIHIFNHSADWYAHPRVRDPLEPAWEIELTFADGTTQKQWGNPRLWNLYRGTSVGPPVLQSLLMAFEKWLLGCAENYPEQLDAILVDVLRRSRSTALAAVAASVATAHPHAAGEALLVFLSAPDYITLDRGRLANEIGASVTSGMFPQLLAENKIHEKEREKANGLPHRRQDLEYAILNLQFGPLAHRVQAMLDQHAAALPPHSDQDQSVLMWRLAIHRMDLRQYTISDAVSMPDGIETSPGESARRYLWLEPNDPEPDVQTMVDESAAELGAMNARLSVLNWGRQVFEHRDGQHDPSLWRHKLAEARGMERQTERDDGSHQGPGFVAAVCIRDQWDQMTVEEQNWCVEVVCSEILQNSEQWNRFHRMQRFPMAADRPCAFVVSSLLAKPLADPQMQCVRRAFTAAITHPVEEVRWSAAWGVDGHFWAGEPVVAMRCVNAIALEVMLIEQAWETEKARLDRFRRPIDDIFAEAAATVRENFWHEGAIANNTHLTVDISTGFGVKAIARMLTILGRVPSDPTAVDAFARASQTLAGWWDAQDNWDYRRERKYEDEAAVSECLQRFVMRSSPASALQVLRPLLEAINRHPSEFRFFILGLTEIEDTNPNTAQYWYLWGLFADIVRSAEWVSRLQGRGSPGSEILYALFLTLGWKDGIRHWKSLEGHAHHIHTLFESLPPSSVVLDSYVHFLYSIGEQSLPGAFIRVAKSLEGEGAQSMLAEHDTVFLLEILLQRHVYGRPLKLKCDPAIRQAILSLLDILIENGSSAAFRMRDDFVTPAA